MYNDFLKSKFVNIKIDSKDWENWHWRGLNEELTVLRGNSQSMQSSSVNVGEDVEDWRCQTCGQILHSKAGYVNLQKFEERQSMHTSFCLGMANMICTMYY